MRAAAARIVALLALDFAGIFGAILTALCLKAALLDAWNLEGSLQETQDTVSFAYLVAVAALRALGPVRRARDPSRPVADRLRRCSRRWR